MSLECCDGVQVVGWLAFRWGDRVMAVAMLEAIEGVMQGVTEAVVLEAVEEVRVVLAVFPGRCRYPD